MKLYLFLVILILFLHEHGYAQADTTMTRDGEIKLSSKFQKALDDAFSFTPQQAPLPQQTPLTREQLHQWVGKPNQYSNNKPNPKKFDSTYKALKMWEKEFYVPINIRPKSIDLGIGLTKADGPQCVQLDINSLGRFLRPKEYRLYKLRKGAARIKAQMDELYPILISDDTTTR